MERATLRIIILLIMISMQIKAQPAPPASHIITGFVLPLRCDPRSGDIYNIVNTGFYRCSAAPGTWSLLAASGSVITSILGTANQITANTVANVTTLSFPVAGVTLPGVTTIANGTAGAPSLQWNCSGCGKLGFYKFDEFTLGFPDNSLRFQSSGTAATFVNLNGGNLDIGQNLTHSFDITFYNASGVGSGNTVALLSDTNLLFGPFSGGALNTGIVRDNADGILNIANAGLTLQPLKFVTQAPGDSSTKGATTAFVTNALANNLARPCTIDNDTQSATVLTTAQITGRCDVPSASHLIEVRIRSDAGTPSVLLEKWHCSGFTTGTCTGYTKTDLLSATLPAATGGFNACARTAISQPCIDGTTSSGTVTISVSALAAGDIINVKSAVITGSPTWVHLEAIYTID